MIKKGNYFTHTKFIQFLAFDVNMTATDDDEKELYLVDLYIM